MSRRVKQMICLESWIPTEQQKFTIPVEKDKIYYIRVDPAQNEFFWAREENSNEFGWVPVRCLKGNQKYSNEEAEILLKEAYNKFDEDADFPLVTESTLMGKYLTPTMYQQFRNMATSTGYTIDMAIQCGVDEENTIGILAGDEESYVVFEESFNPIISHLYAGYSMTNTHPVSNMNQTQLPTECFDETFILSMQLETNRNIRNFSLPPWNNRAQRRTIETIMKTIFGTMENNSTGKYEAVEDMTDERMKELENNQFLSKPVSFSMSRDWPESRGIFIDSNEQIIISVNETNHLHIIAKEQTANIQQLYNTMCHWCSSMENGLKDQNYEFMHDEHVGYITSCPSNLGMKFSANMKIPLLLQHEQFETILQNLQLRQTKNENQITEEDETETITISNLLSVGFTEVTLMEYICHGVEQLIELEKTLMSEQDITEMIPEPMTLSW